MRRLLLLTVVLAAISACDSVTEEPDVECVEPPASELVAGSEFEISLEPNAVAAGSEATLMVDHDESGDYSGDVGASWECWNGSEWVQTHVLVRAFNQYAPETVDLSTHSTIAIPDIGLVIPNAHTILIPDVPPGLYRITDHLYAPETHLTAHVTVEVVHN